MSEELDKLNQEIRNSLRKAEVKVNRIQLSNTSLLVISIFSSAATTLVTAITAANGPIIGEGPAGWRTSCIIAAVFGFVTTVCISLNQQFHFSDRLARSRACAGRLRSLDVSITTGSRKSSETAREYEEIVKEFSDSIH